MIDALLEFSGIINLRRNVHLASIFTVSELGLQAPNPPFSKVWAKTKNQPLSHSRD